MPQTRDFDPETIRVLAQQQHAEFVGRETTPCYANPLEVGHIAARLARKFYYGDPTTSGTGQVTLAQCAGNLVYALELWGYNFDGVVDVAAYDVARVVSGLSADGRLPQGLRIGHHCSTLREADAMSQLVKLAEIISLSQRIITTTDADLVRHGDRFRAWADDARALLEAMHRLRARPQMKTVMLETREGLGKIGRLVERARLARRDAKLEARRVLAAATAAAATAAAAPAQSVLALTTA